MRRAQAKRYQTWKARYVIDREQAFANSRAETLKNKNNQDTLMSRSRCIFLHLNPWRQRWDYLVMIFACANCFLVPIELAVEIDFVKATWYVVLNYVMDFVFVLDLLVNFNTTYDQGYDVIYSRSAIAKQYLQTRFTVDIVSALPVDLVGSIFFGQESAQLKLFSLLKLTRMLRLSRIIRALNVRRDLKSKIKLLKVFFQMILYLHCQACMVWFLIHHDELWYNPVLVNEIIWDSRFYADALYAQYFTSFHLSVLAFYGNDVLPYSTLHFAIQTFMILIGLAVQGQLLGTFAEIVFEMNEISTISQEQADSSVAAMSQVSLDKDTKTSAINYVKTVSMERYMQDQFQIFQQQVSPNLMNKINRTLLEIFVTAKQANAKTIFDGSDPYKKDKLMHEIFEMSKLLVLQDHSMQSVLMEQGDDCDGFYVLQKGTVEIHVMQQNSKMCKPRDIDCTGVFGEVSFFFKTKRTATIICKENVRVFYLDLNYKKNFMSLCPMLYRRIREQVYSYRDKSLEQKVKILRESVHYLKHVEREALVELAFQVSIKGYQKDTLIQKQLKALKSVIVVFDGIVQAQLPSGEGNILFEKLPTGSSYGQYSILRYKEKGLGASRFQLKTQRYTWLIHISPDLLFGLREKHKQIDKQMSEDTIYVELKGVPLCDFQVNNEAMDNFRSRIRKGKITRANKLKEEQNLDYYNSNHQDRQPKVRFNLDGQQNYSDNSGDQKKIIKENDQGFEGSDDDSFIPHGHASDNSPGPSLESQPGDEESELTIGDSSLGSSLLSEFQEQQVESGVMRMSTKRKKYRKVMIRAVRRQILLNVHRKKLLKQFKIGSAMVTAMEHTDLIVEEEDQTNQHKNNVKLNRLLNDKVFDVVQSDQFPLIDLVEMMILQQTNKASQLDKTLKSINEPCVSAYKLKQALYGRLEMLIKDAQVKVTRLELQRRPFQLKQKLAKEAKEKQEAIPRVITSIAKTAEFL